MRKTLMQLATLGALGALLAIAPRAASADDYELQGRWFGGTDIGVMQPLNALDRYVTTGGVLAPFVGYKFFDDKDLQLNFGLLGQMQFIGAGADPCTGCTRGLNDNTMLALAFHAGPRISLPYGPLEFYGQAQGGVLTGIAPEAPSAISDTSAGFLAGGGLNYALTDTFSLGLFANWNRWYQRVHGVGDVRYVNTGIQVMLQQPQEAAPAPVAQVPPPPPPPPAPPMKKKIVLRGVNFDFDKYNIRPDAVPILEQACKTLKEEPNIDVSCDGYTDAIGTVAYNQALSERRANAVRQWLIKCGVPASRLSARGFGKSNPVATNDTAEGRAQNRRTELLVK
ncbi:MAG: OmpA family protein [Deltaproteobacteria bacterium]|nr:OmpA family protein [Deltaproteobacteria bacterium]